MPGGTELSFHCIEVVDRMKPLSKMLGAAALAVLLLAGVSAQARSRRPKNFNLNVNPLANVKSEQPDKVLYDKAMKAMKKGRYDEARLDLQTLLNTYPDSEYRMRAKLSVGDTWYKEGGSAALTQAEAEYQDFITFFPNSPEAAEAKMKIADIYYQQMQKPDRDYTNALEAERQYREMIKMFPDSSLIPRAEQQLRNVQEVLAQREFLIGQYYQSQDNYPAALARLETVAARYPLYSRSDQVLIDIGDCYEAAAHSIAAATSLPGAVRERLRTVYLNRAAAAYDKVITRYPMAAHVEDARDRLVALNRPIPEPTQSAIAENDAEERSRQPLHFADKTLGLIKSGPTVVEAAHVGQPTMVDPARIIAPDITRENIALYREALGESKPAPVVATTPTPANQLPRTGRPSAAPLQVGVPGGGSGVGVKIVTAPSGPVASDPNAVVKPVGPVNSVLPPVQQPSSAPVQVNDIKPGEIPEQSSAAVQTKQKKPKVDLSGQSSSSKKKKRGLKRFNPF